MLLRFALAMFACLGFCATGLAQTLDPEGRIRPGFLQRALDATAARRQDDNDPRKLVVVDYSLHSSKERLFVLDLDTGQVSAYRVSHGKGSDTDHDGYLDSFSDTSGSSASPEGTFRTAEEYSGRHGRSLRLDGLDTTNAKARSRAIVIHAAEYAEPAQLKKYGKLGRSNGCIVFASADLSRFLEEVPKGTLIFVGK